MLNRPSLNLHSTIIFHQFNCVETRQHEQCTSDCFSILTETRLIYTTLLNLLNNLIKSGIDMEYYIFIVERIYRFKSGVSDWSIQGGI